MIPRLYICCCLVALLLSVPVQGQPAWSQCFQLATKATFIAADPLGKLYIVTPANEIQQYAPDGRLLYKYNDNTLGELTRVDATDPFQPMLYYADFQSVAILDRTLNPLSVINLWEYGMSSPIPPAMSNDNLLWVFDQPDFRLRKLDRRGNVIHDSGDLNTVFTPAPRPVEMLCRHNLVILNDPETGLWLFDNFGQHIETLPFTGSSQVQSPEPGLLLFCRQGQWISYQIEFRKESQFHLPPGIPSSAQIIAIRNYIFALYNGHVQCWSR